VGAGQIFNLPRTDDFSRRGKVPSHLTAKVVSTVAFQNKITNLSCTLFCSEQDLIIIMTQNNIILSNAKFLSIIFFGLQIEFIPRIKKGRHFKNACHTIF